VPHSLLRSKASLKQVQSGGNLSFSIGQEKSKDENFDSKPEMYCFHEVDTTGLQFISHLDAAWFKKLIKSESNSFTYITRNVLFTTIGMLRHLLKPKVKAIQTKTKPHSWGSVCFR